MMIISNIIYKEMFGICYLYIKDFIKYLDLHYNKNNYDIIL
jgi:hypothetical protein